MNNLNVQWWPTDRLLPYARNTRTHTDDQVAQIAASIREFGFVNPVLIGADGVLIAGHGRLLAARKLAMADVPVIVLEHLDESQRRALAIADNRIGLNAGWDEEMLRIELASLQAENVSLELLGFTDQELGALLAEAKSQAIPGNTDEDAVPNEPENPVSSTGDVWMLGDHRLLCGDSTRLESVDRILGGELADLVFTDPPYNVNYEGYTEDRLSIQGDSMSPEDFRRFLRAAFAACRRGVKAGASVYVCHPSSWQREFQNALESAGFSIRCQIIWAKNTFAWGFGRYKFQHEPIFYCHVTGQTDSWFGDKSQSTLWQERKPVANRLHPTMKPVELIDRALVNSSKAGDIALDLFGGSGSTLIACERTGRKARLVEIDPRYCDVILERWQDFTGRKAVRQDGTSFDELRNLNSVPASVNAL
jgi:DNA modification methylase